MKHILVKRQLELIARAVVVHRSKILLCRARGAAYYFLPGGHVEFGERAVDALRREMREELGVAAKIGRFIGAVENVFLRKKKKVHELNLVFLASLGKKATASRESHIEFSWKDKKNIGRERILPTVLKQSVAQWLKNHKTFWASAISR